MNHLCNTYPSNSDKWKEKKTVLLIPILTLSFYDHPILEKEIITSSNPDFFLILKVFFNYQFRLGILLITSRKHQHYYAKIILRDSCGTILLISKEYESGKELFVFQKN